MLRRVLAVIVLALVALVAIRLVVGFLAAVLWLVVLVALIAGGLWAWSTLRSGRRRRDVEPSRSAELAPAHHEDRVAAEMQRIREQLREQGRG